MNLYKDLAPAKLHHCNITIFQLTSILLPLIKDHLKINIAFYTVCYPVMNWENKRSP